MTKLRHTQINATGTPDGTTYLRGDGAWAVPSGGGGGATTDGGVYPFDVAPGTASAFDDEFTGSSLGGSWTHLGATALTLTVAHGVVAFEPSATGQASIGKRAAGIYKTSPTGNFTVTARLGSTLGLGDDASGGLFIASAGSTAHVYGMGRNGSNSAVYIGAGGYSDTADWGGYDGSVSDARPALGEWNYYRIVYAGGTVTFSHSANGALWMDTASRTGVPQPTRLGLAVYSNSGGMRADHGLWAGWVRVTEP